MTYCLCDLDVIVNALHRLNRSGDAHLFIKLVEEMTSANLIHRFESRLDSRLAETGTRMAEMASKLDVQLGTQNARIEAQLGAQNDKSDTQLGIQNDNRDALFAKMDTQAKAPISDMSIITCGIGVIIGLIIGFGATIIIITVLH